MEDAPERPKRKRRLSLTKKQRRSSAGSELLVLCETITEDGSLNDTEIQALKDWVTSNSDSDLPAHGFLLDTLLRIVADRKISPDEHVALYEALEKVLPPDIRSATRRRRRNAEAREWEDALRIRSEKEARERPLGTWDFTVAGSMYEGRPGVVTRYARKGDPVYLVRDQANEYSRNAVEVRLRNGMQIGFVPEDFASDVAPLLDAGNPHIATLTKIVQGSRAPIPIVLASVHRPDAEVANLTSQQDVPTKTQPAGCDLADPRRPSRSEVIVEEKMMGLTRDVSRNYLVPVKQQPRRRGLGCAVLFFVSVFTLIAGTIAAILRSQAGKAHEGVAVMGRSPTDLGDC